MKRIRLLLVITTSDFGGTETFLKDLVTRIDRQRFSPIVCSLCPPGRIGREIAAAGVDIVTLDMSPRPRVPELIRGSFALAKIMDGQSVDVVQSLLYRANFLSAMASRISRRRPNVISSQRSLTPLGGWPATLTARLSRHFFRQLVAVSPAAKDEVVRTLRFPSEKVKIIPNGVDLQKYRPADGEAVRNRLGLSGQSLMVGGVGRLATAKGFGYLLEALAIVRRNGLEIQLSLVGDGPEAPRLRQKSRALGISEQVTFFGARSDLESIYPAFEVFVLPSLEEGSPMALLEAMASGCAIVATRVGGVPDIVEPNRSGLLVEPGSSTQLAEALRRLYQDPGLRDKLGVQARSRVGASFDLTQTVRTYEDIYMSICD